MIRVVCLTLVICGFFLGLGLSLLEHSLVLGLGMVVPNALFMLNALFFLAMDLGTRERAA